MRAKSMQNAPRACANQSSSCSPKWSQIISEVALEFSKNYNATLEKALAPLCSLSDPRAEYVHDKPMFDI